MALLYKIFETNNYGLTFFLDLFANNVDIYHYHFLLCECSTNLIFVPEIPLSLY